jgi:hypothetical protein
MPIKMKWPLNGERRRAKEDLYQRLNIAPSNFIALFYLRMNGAFSQP